MNSENPRERDLPRELENHLYFEAADQGDPREAQRTLGNLTRIREDTRAAWGSRRLDDLRGDLVFGCRQVAKSPMFAAVAILSLGLAIGANTAIYTLVNAIIL